MNDFGKNSAGSRFNCLGNACPSHCCRAYEGFSDRLIPLNGVKFSEIILTDKDRKMLLELEREDLIVYGTNGIAQIKTAKDGTCYALKDGRCSIYSARPSICRAYPFYLDFYVGLCVLKE